jgi:hypothetical protein
MLSVMRTLNALSFRIGLTPVTKRSSFYSRRGFQTRSYASRALSATFETIAASSLSNPDAATSSNVSSATARRELVN